jgi:hypothetical protein
MGLLDNFTNWAQSSQSQPAADGLLAAGLGILANNRGLTSGTQAIGMGGLQGLQAYQSSKRLNMDQQLQNAQLQQLAFGLQKNKMLMGLAQQYLGGSSGAQATPGAGPAPSTPPPMDAGGMPAGPGGSGAGVQSSPVQMGAAQTPPELANSQSSAQARGEAEYWAATNPQNRAATAQALGYVPQAPAAATPPQQAATPQSGPFGNMPGGLVAYGLMTDPAKLFENAAAQYSPTDLQKTMRAAGIDPNSTLGKQILQQNIAKTNYIAPVGVRPGGGLQEADGTIRTMPAAAPPGYQAVQGADGSWSYAPVAGGTAAVTQSAGAEARGKAGYKTEQVYNPATKSMELQPVTNIVDQANGGAQTAPAPIRNNNPGAMMPGGKLATYPSMQAGLDSMDNNLQSYGKQGVNTLAGVISKWAPPNENDTGAYIQDVSQRLGLKPDQPIDLSNPLVRHAISAGIALHENGPGGVFGQSGSQGSSASASSAQPQGGAFAAAPPLGVTTNTDTSQKGGAEAMNTSFAKLQAARSTGQQALEGLNKMQQLAASKSFMSAGPLGTDLTAINPAAAEYQKQRANVVTLLANQNGTNGTDAGRALTGDSVPDYGKPQSAIKDGLGTLANQTHLNMLKASVLTPAFNAGDSNAYNALENQFDQTIKPSMMPTLNTVISMPSGPARAAALSSAAKDPQMRSALEILIKGGALK